MITYYIVLFALIIVLVCLISIISTFVFSKSKTKDKENDIDPLISTSEKNYIQPEIKPIEVFDKRAVVLCSHNKTFSVERNELNKQHTCFMINSDNGTGTDCKYSCIGLGDCVKMCPQQAIEIINHTAYVTNLCNGCGKCIDICPVHIIKLIPKDSDKIILCGNVTKYPTSCSNLEKEEKIEWNDKKDFKIWKSCYKIIKNLIKS